MARTPDERGTYRSADEAIRLYRAGDEDAATDLNPMAIDMFMAWQEIGTEDVAHDQTLEVMFGDDPIPGEEVTP